MSDRTYLVAESSLATEEFDGETVLVDVQRGLYFSLRGAATELWRAFTQKRDQAGVVEALLLQLPGSDRAGLEGAIRTMQDHGLLVASNDGPAASPPQFVASSPAFVPPAVEIYSDLADLIAIDPVHEVDATAGWPIRPDNFPDVG